jgi:hypothetical protein
VESWMDSLPEGEVGDIRIQSARGMVNKADILNVV